MAQALLVVGDFMMAVNQLNDAGVHRVRLEDLAAGMRTAGGRKVEAPAPLIGDVDGELEALNVVMYWLMLDGPHYDEARQWLVTKFGMEQMLGYMP